MFQLKDYFGDWQGAQNAYFTDGPRRQLPAGKTLSAR